MRTLKANEIDLRVGSTSRKGDKASLLLYKDARCDMTVLDEIYGADKWQSKYTRIGDVLYCSIGVYNDEIKEWVWKTSNGIESKGTGQSDPNNVKGEASDAFKRAGFMWGIGRELYEWSGIWVEHNKDKDKYAEYTVKEIAYDKDRKPKTLVIEKKHNYKSKIVYELRNGSFKKQSNSTKKTTKKEQKSDDKDYQTIDLLAERNKKMYKNILIFGIDLLSENGISYDGTKNEILDIVKKEFNNVVKNDLKLNIKNIELLQNDSQKQLDVKKAPVYVDDVKEKLDTILRANYERTAEDDVF